MQELTPKQQRFAEEYIRTGNAAASYINAGYKAKTKETAYSNASSLLRNHKVEKYINEKMDLIAGDTVAEQEEIMVFLTAVMRDEDRETRDRMKAAEQIGKRYGMWSDRQIVENSSEIEIKVRAELEAEYQSKTLDNIFDGMEQQDLKQLLE